MATRRAIASGNWSTTSTWNGGVLPGNGDTVYSNGFTVTIDQNVDIGGANNPTVNAGSFVSGQWYEITSVGTTPFTGIGAAANTIGTIFQASGVGSGTGQARARATLTTATNTAAGATTGGGGFALAAFYNMTCDLRAGTTNCLAISANNLNLNGLQFSNSSSPCFSYSGTGTLSISNSTLNALATSQIFATNSSSGTINIASSSFTTGSGTSSNGINNASNGNIIVSGSTFNSDNGYCINNASIGNITIDSSILISGRFFPVVSNAGSGGVAITNSTLSASTTLSQSAACVTTVTGNVTITGSTISASTLNVAINNTSTASITCISCTFNAANGFAAISSTNASATNRFSGTFISSANGTQPINATRWILNSSPTNSYIQHALDGINANSFVRFFTGDNSTALNQAAPTDVRSGVAYGIGNSQTGRLTVPARGSVALSVNYGPSMPFTATRSGATATATLAYSYPLVVGDQITVTGASNTEWNSTYTIASVVSGTSVTFVVPNTHSASAGTGALMQTTGTAVLDPAAVASAVWGAASRTITGGVVDTLTNAPSVPSASAIASQVRTELGTELGRIDAAISSRLAPSGTLATVTNLTNAPASVTPSDIWSHASRTVTGGTVDTLTNAPTVPSAAAIASQVRSELSVELARVDAAITTRATPANIPAADIAAIKAKTDAVNVDRINNTATLSQVGNLLAQANS